MTNERLGNHLPPIEGEDIVISIVPERSLGQQSQVRYKPEMPLPIFPMDFFDPEEGEFQQPLINFPEKPPTEEEMRQRLDLYGRDETKFR